MGSEKCPKSITYYLKGPFQLNKGKLNFVAGTINELLSVLNENVYARMILHILWAVSLVQMIQKWFSSFQLYLPFVNLSCKKDELGMKHQVRIKRTSIFNPIYLTHCFGDVRFDPKNWTYGRLADFSSDYSSNYMFLNITMNISFYALDFCKGVDVISLLWVSLAICGGLHSWGIWNHCIPKLSIYA